jgi:hypothetical protein
MGIKNFLDQLIQDEQNREAVCHKDLNDQITSATDTSVYNPRYTQFFAFIIMSK